MINTAKIRHALIRLQWLWFLLGWIAALFFLPLFHAGETPLDEGAARGLLLNWSIYHQVASPIVLLGIPDARALFFIPVTLYWPGSLVAPRVLWAIFAFFAAWAIHAWARERLGKEQALLGTGLLLLAPLTITQIDTLGGGLFLLFCFIMGYWMERRYQRVGRPLGGWFYTRFLWTAITVSIHPAGLAYPLALLWHWWRDPDKSERLKKQNLLGIVIALALLGLLQAGWGAVPWGADPREALGLIFHSTELDPFPAPWEAWVIALAVLGLAAANGRRLLNDLFSTTLTFALILGLMAANVDWAFLMFVFLLLWGMDALLRLNELIPGEGLAAKRGIVLGMVVILAVVFMRDDRAYAQMIRADVHSAHAILLREVAVEVEQLGKFARILSQWPGQTMIVCKCDVLALPPPSENPEQLLSWLEAARATHLVFNPQQPENAALNRDVANLADTLRTLFINEAGVVVGVLKNLEEAARKAEEARREEALPEETLNGESREAPPSAEPAP